MRTAYEQNVITKMLPLYGISKVIPVRMRSSYSVTDLDGKYEPETSTWWQWRGRVWKHKVFKR